MPGHSRFSAFQALRFSTSSGQNGYRRHWVGLAGWMQQPSESQKMALAAAGFSETKQMAVAYDVLRLKAAGAIPTKLAARTRSSSVR